MVDYGADVNHQSYSEHWQGMTPIFSAVHGLDCLEILLTNRADPNYRLPLSGNTLLHFCAKSPKNLVAAANALLKHNADITIKNAEQKTPWDVLLEHPKSDKNGAMYQLFKIHYENKMLNNTIGQVIQQGGMDF